MNTNSAYHAPTTPSPSVTANSQASGSRTAQARPVCTRKGQRVSPAPRSAPPATIWNASKSWNAAPSASSGRPRREHLRVVDVHAASAPRARAGRAPRSPTARPTARLQRRAVAALGGGEVAGALVAPDQRGRGEPDPDRLHEREREQRDHRLGRRHRRVAHAGHEAREQREGAHVEEPLAADRRARAQEAADRGGGPGATGRVSKRRARAPAAGSADERAAAPTHSAIDVAAPAPATPQRGEPEPAEHEAVGEDRVRRVRRRSSRRAACACRRCRGRRTRAPSRSRARRSRSGACARRRARARASRATRRARARADRRRATKANTASAAAGSHGVEALPAEARRSGARRRRPCACETKVCTPLAVPLKTLKMVQSQIPAKPSAPSSAAPRRPTKIESTTCITVCDICVSTIGIGEPRDLADAAGARRRGRSGGAASGVAMADPNGGRKHEGRERCRVRGPRGGPYRPRSLPPDATPAETIAIKHAGYVRLGSAHGLQAVLFLPRGRSRGNRLSVTRSRGPSPGAAARAPRAAGDGTACRAARGRHPRSRRTSTASSA